MAGRVSELPYVAPREEVRDSPHGLARNAEEQRLPGNPRHLRESIAGSLQMLEHLERADTVERLVVEGELVGRRRLEGEERLLTGIPLRAHRLVTEVDADCRHSRELGEACGHDSLTAADVEDRARLERNDQLVDLREEARQ